MEKTRLAISLFTLVTVVLLGSSWLIPPVHAGDAPPVEGYRECNCIEGFSRQAGTLGWDPEQRRYRCIPINCYVII